MMSENLRAVDIFTDGACSGNPGPGGYGVILRCGAYEKELSGGEAMTTNNRMELSGAIAGLSALRERCRVTLYSDSSYVINGLGRGWARKWRANGWKKADKSPALNADLWDRLLTLCEQHDVKLVWVKGHAGHPENERCDRLAVAESKKFAV
jgi:ribonuclease HI